AWARALSRSAFACSSQAACALPTSLPHFAFATLYSASAFVFSNSYWFFGVLLWASFDWASAMSFLLSASAVQTCFSLPFIPLHFSSAALYSSLLFCFSVPCA